MGTWLQERFEGLAVDGNVDGPRPAVVVGFGAQLLLLLLVFGPLVSGMLSGQEWGDARLWYTRMHNICFPLSFALLLAMNLWGPHYSRNRFSLLVMSMVAFYAVPFAAIVMGQLGLECPTPLIVASGIFGGFGQGLGYVLWQQVLSMRSGRQIALECCGGSAFAGALFFIVSWFPAAGMLVFSVISVAVSGIALLRFSPCVSVAEQSFKTEFSLRCLLPFARQNIGPVVVVCLVGCTWSFFHALALKVETQDVVSGFNSLARIASAAGAFYLLTAKRDSSPLRAYAAIAVPACCTAALAFPLFGSPALVAVSVFVYVVFGASSIVVMVACARESGRLGLHPSVVFCLVYGIICLSTKIGSNTAHLFLGAGALSGDQIFSLAAALVVVYLFAMAGCLLRWGSDRRGMSECVASPPSSVASNHEVLSEHAASEPSLESAILDAFDFTSREREVAAYLLKGRDVAFICDALGLSKNTVRSHIKNVYQKAGVHSKQELISLEERSHPDI